MIAADTGTMSIAEGGRPCPLCASEAHWKKVNYVYPEPNRFVSHLTIGCASCRLWLPLVPTEAIDQGGAYSALFEVSANLLARWNERTDGGVEFFPAATFVDRLMCGFRGHIRRFRGSDIAKELDVSGAYVSQLANGKNTISLRSMANVLHAIEQLEKKKGIPHGQ